MLDKLKARLTAEAIAIDARFDALESEAAREGLGFRVYNATTPSQAAPLFLPAGVPTPVPVGNAGGGPSRYRGLYAGRDAVSGGRFRSFVSGETFTLRLALTGYCTMAGQRLDVGMDIGGSQGEIERKRDLFPANAGQAGKLLFNFTGYALDTFLANGAAFIATATEDAYVWSPSLLHMPGSLPS